jgi:O-antigen ligase
MDPEVGMRVFDVVAIFVAWQLLRSRDDADAPPRGLPLASACLLALGLLWAGTLALRPSGSRAFLEAQGIFCAILLFTSLSRRALHGDTMVRFVHGVLFGSLGTAAFGQYQYWVAFPRTLPLAKAAGIPAITLINANFYNANCYAVFLSAVALLAGQLAAARHDRFAWMMIPILLVTILLTESRSAVVLLALGALGLAWAGGSRLRIDRNRMVADGLWVVLPAAAGAAAAVVDFKELWHVGTLGRLAIWSGSLALLRDHWLSGVGLGRFADAYMQYRVNTYYTRYPHSFLLEIAAELGVVGVVVVVGFFAAAFRQPISLFVSAARGVRHDLASSLALAIGASCALLLVHGLLDIDWHAPANPILLFTLLGAAQRPSVSDPAAPPRAFTARETR